MKVAVIWARFGAYHLARLRGAAEVGGNLDARVVGIEIAQKDHYAWEIESGAQGFERITVFPGSSYDDLTPARIRREVARVLADLRPDAVAINGWSMPEARAAIAWCRRRPEAAAILMSETKQDDGGRRLWWKEIFKGWLVRRCDAALVGGRPQADYLQRLGFPPELIFHGYDVVDNAYFAQGADRVRRDAAGYRARYNLPERYFFACTRFLPRKNIAGLLRAYAAYRNDSPAPWDLVVAGGGDEGPALQQLQSDLGLQGVHWPGFVQYRDLPVYFGLASAFIHSALSEPWGLVVNEAAASGLPLLVSRTVGARYELVEVGGNGILFDPGSVEAMTGALRIMSDFSDVQRAAMGRRSVEIVAEWSPRRFGEGLFAAIDKCRETENVKS